MSSKTWKAHCCTGIPLFGITQNSFKGTGCAQGSLQTVLLKSSRAASPAVELRSYKGKLFPCTFKAKIDYSSCRKKKKYNKIIKPNKTKQFSSAEKPFCHLTKATACFATRTYLSAPALTAPFLTTGPDILAGSIEYLEVCVLAQICLACEITDLLPGEGKLQLEKFPRHLWAFLPYEWKTTSRQQNLCVSQKLSDCSRNCSIEEISKF